MTSGIYLAFQANKHKKGLFRNNFHIGSVGTGLCKIVVFLKYVCTYTYVLFTESEEEQS